MEIAFGPFILDTANNRLAREGVELEVRPRVFQALKTLIQNSGRYVSHNQMIAEAWEGISVSRHTVAVTVGEVKKVLQECGAWIRCRPKLGYRLEVPESEDLIRRGRHFFNRRTREGFEKALCCFERAAADETAGLRAFEGMALSYLLLGTYGMRPPRIVYPKFLRAHEQAVAAAGLTPALRAHRAHALHMFERKLEEAESELLRAQRDDPALISVYVRLTMLYATLGQLDRSFETLARGRAVDELDPALAAVEVFVLFCRGDLDAAITRGKQMVELHPYVQLGRAFYAQALSYSGQTDAALAEYRRACILSPDLPWLRALEGTCLAKAGRQCEAWNIFEELQRTRETEYADAYFMALLLDALGKRDQAFDELERAYNENSSTLFLLKVDPRMDSLRADQRFSHFEKRLFEGA